MKTLEVNSKKFRAYQEAKERSAAAAALAEKARADAGIPGTNQLVSELGRSKKKREIVIVDENGAPMGKISLYWQKQAVIAAGFRSRIS